MNIDFYKIKTIRRLGLIVLLYCLSLSYGYSQSITKGTTPMHNFFRQYADSTIIIEYPSNTFDSPKYRIISKTKDTINCFTYVPKDSSLHKTAPVLPKKLEAFLRLKKGEYTRQPADINPFFFITKLPSDTSKSLWATIQNLKIWKLGDDSVYGSGCPKDKPRSIVMDGDYHIVYLITKKEIKTLSFYAPAFYENQCPGNINRQTIIKLEKIIEKIIPLN